MSAVFAELSVNSGIKNLKILPNQKVGGLKPITSVAMIPLKWSIAAKFLTCLNKTTDLTKRITGNKPGIFKLVITLGSEVEIVQTVEENAIDMAQDGIITELERLKVIHFKKGLLITMLKLTSTSNMCRKWPKKVPSKR